MISPTFGEGYTFYEPIKLHPENPNYLWFRGEPTLLISSAEHYGAVINKGFDYEKYLETLKEEGMNYTRIFVGTYVEQPGAFSIQYNTLAPSEGDLIVPWRRSNEPGYIGGGNKFDLDQWDDQYFERLHNFLQRANELWIVVEVTFFTSHFGMWEFSPMYSANNINQLPDISVNKVLTKENGRLMHYQERLVRKIVRELNRYDNVFYELQNEPYVEHGVMFSQPDKNNPKEIISWQAADQDSQEWQNEIASFIVDEESSLMDAHLIAQNVAKEYVLLEEVSPNISVINLHYALPKAVHDNYHLNKALSLDETGFIGHNPDNYRKQAWAFLLSGGAVYNNLDYSFYNGKEDGTGENQAPGTGGPILRRYLRILKEFMLKLDFLRLKPRPDLAQAEGQIVYVLAEEKKVYAGYVSNAAGNTIKLKIPKGIYRLQWYDPLTGDMLEMKRIDLPEDYISISTGDGVSDKAFIIRRQTTDN